MVLLDNVALVLEDYGTGRADWDNTRASELVQSYFDGQPEFQRRAIFTITAS